MKNRRSKKLIMPREQLSISAKFAGVAVFSLLMQALLLSSMLLSAADDMPQGSQFLVDLVPSLLGRSLLFSLLLVSPLVVWVGVLTTFKVVGPAYRFQSYLREVLEKKTFGECRIRKGDYFQELCQLITESTAQLRSENASTTRPEEAKAA